MWHEDSITPGELDALRKAAQQAWAEDTRYPLTLLADRSDRGQCYVTSRWLVGRLGGKVARRDGHYVWMDDEEQWIIDLTGNHGHGELYSSYEGQFYSPCEAPVNERTRRFAKRANQIFDNLDGILKLGLDYMGDGLPAQEPQRADDIAQQQFLHDEPEWEPSSAEYRFVYGNGQLEVSADHAHQELAQHAQIPDDHLGPMAMGHIIVSQNKATWEVQTNMNIRGLDRIFRDYTKHVGWEWGGITNIEGEPISDEFAPKKGRTLHWAYARDHLYLGRTSSAALALSTGADQSEGFLCGVVRIQDRHAFVSPVHQSVIPSLSDWAFDEGLILYAGNDNVLKTHEDLELENLGDNKNTLEPQQKQPGVSDYDEREPSGVYKCPACNRLFPNWGEYQAHRRDEENTDSDFQEDGHFPENDMDATFPTHFTEQQPFVFPVAHTEAARVEGFNGDDEGDFYVAYHFGSPVGYAHLKENKLVEIKALRTGVKEALQAKVMKYADKQPKDLLEEPIPFIYDINEDTINVGHPGQRTSDIPGQFTPGGIVEGNYEPGGKAVIRTMTNIPYSVKHIIELWYYQHPELSVTGLELQDDKGGRTKLAADDIGGYVASLVAADPAANSVTSALKAAGGHVYAVGGAVRDAVKGTEPKDIDLMVGGLETPQIQEALSHLPGRVDLTGRSFGVFRYRAKDGGEVEIALPRTEHSTGEGHTDFDVQADPHLSAEEDLFRRDFTANAMAVDLSNGRLVDPYNGRGDIQQGILRAHNPNALAEDPLRVVRALVANGRHGLVPDDGTKAQMSANAEGLQHLPQERIQAELDKLFASDNPAAAIKLARQTGTLQYILPEVDQAFGYNQNNPHHELELGDHLVNVLDRASQKTDDPDVRLAGLLHDIGKPASAWTDPETASSHFYEKHMPDGTVLGQNHEDVGADMTRALMNRLRYPKDRTDRVTDLVQHHMWDPFTTPRGARRFLQRVGPHADDLMDLRWADQGGKSQYPSKPEVNLDTQRNLLEQARNTQAPTQRSQLAINGNDLIQAGIPAGPQIGSILSQLTDAVVDDPTLNEPEKLLTMAQRMLYSNGT